MQSDRRAPATPPERRPLHAPARDLPDGGRILHVPAYAAGDRLDAFLVRHGGDPPRTRAEWQRLVEAEMVLVNGKPSKSGIRVAAGDLVRVTQAPPATFALPVEEVPFDVLHEDPAMIVITKPAGVVVHPAPGNESGTLVNGLLARFPELRDVTGDLRPGIVHRLDKDTSGVMVVGRTAAATADLQKQMHDRETEKRYLLLAAGNIAEDEGLIEAPIARDPRQRQRMAVRPGGRAARTRFYVLERFGDYTFVEALLLTGRTHQLRVHFASIGRPIAGDELYGHGRAPGGLRRQFLHSYFLRVRSPADHEWHEFTAPLPFDLTRSLESLRRRAGRPPSPEAATGARMPKPAPEPTPVPGESEPESEP